MAMTAEIRKLPRGTRVVFNDPHLRSEKNGQKATVIDHSKIVGSRGVLHKIRFADSSTLLVTLDELALVE